jgi:hypothetical protein
MDALEIIQTAIIVLLVVEVLRLGGTLDAHFRWHAVDEADPDFPAGE